MKQKIPTSFIKYLIIFGLLTLARSSLAAQTSGGVNWLDPLGYQKPQFYSISYPSVSDCGANVWYVDLSAGSGSTCSQAAPCSWAAVASKSGVGSGGPATIYIKGSGALSDISIVGSVGHEVVVKPWDDNTTATITGRNNWADNKQYLIFDGGPNMQIRFVNSTGGQFDPSVYFNSSISYNQREIKFYRVRWQATNSLGMWVASWGSFQNVYWINNEFYSAESQNQQHIYLSGGTNGPRTMNGVYIINSILRNTGGEAIELRMANAGTVLTNLIIDGNAFHNIGNGTCSGSWKCRSAITFSDEGGGSFSTPIRVSNNLFWNIGEGCMRTWSNPAGTLIYGNSCYNWGMGNPANGAYCSAGFSNYSFNDAPGTYKNNVLYATGNDNNGNGKIPFAGSSSTNKSYNACASGTSCGTNAQVINNATFQSLDPANINFLKPVAGSTLIDKGADLSSTYNNSYFSNTRIAPFDIGAFEYQSGGADTAPPAPPTGLMAQ